MIHDLDLFNNADCKDSLHDYKLEESNLNVEFEPFILDHYEENAFTCDLTTSSFIKKIIETSSGKLDKKLKETLTLFEKDSS